MFDSPRDSTAAVRVRVRGDDEARRARLAGALRAAGARVVEGDEERVEVTVWCTGDMGVTRVPTGSPATLVVLPRGGALAAALSAGARGALYDDAGPERLLAATVAVAAGLRVLDDAASLPSPLSPRETQVLELFGVGLPSKLVADRLGVSENTVKFHAQQIFAKLGVSNRAEALMSAARRGWVPIDGGTAFG